MLTYQLVNNLNIDEDPQWHELTLMSLGPDTHPSRIKGFCLGREALRSCLKMLGLEISITQLQLENYKGLKKFPDLNLSISHTKDFGAAVVASKDQTVSVGIDIEPLSRLVKAPIIDRISHPGDAKLEPIVLWALKEAAFKALMNTGRFEQNEEFSSLLISEDGWGHPPSGVLGEWKTEVQDDVIIALAWIRI